MIDAHQHFWRLSRGDYDWPNDSVAPIFRDFGPEDLRPLLDRAGVRQTVLVQVCPNEAETAFMLDIAAKADFIAGVVGWVDLTAPDAVDRIDWLRQNPLLRGLRPMLQSIDDTAWILQPAARRALAHMAATGLCLDALIQPRHLAVIHQLGRRHPDLKIVVDHLAKPRMGQAQPPDQLWAQGMTALAGLPNLWCKLSGMVTEVGPDWQSADLAGHAGLVLDAFGPDRVMWGSDWPVVNLAADYARWWRQSQDLCAGLSPGERDRVFDGTARDFYGLGAAI